MSKNPKDMTRDEFVAYFCDKSRRLKNTNLPYGMEYINLVRKVEIDAEKIWDREMKKILYDISRPKKSSEEQNIKE